MATTREVIDEVQRRWRDAPSADVIPFPSQSERWRRQWTKPMPVAPVLPRDPTPPEAA